MKTIIAGGRNYSLNPEDWASLNSYDFISEVVTGGASGVDSAALKWAQDKQFKISIFKANWTSLGKMAGPMRNREMAQYADALILFPGGKGTESMLKEAQKAQLIIHDLRKQAQLYLNFSI